MDSALHGLHVLWPPCMRLHQWDFGTFYPICRQRSLAFNAQLSWSVGTWTVEWLKLDPGSCWHGHCSKRASTRSGRIDDTHSTTMIQPQGCVGRFDGAEEGRGLVNQFSGGVLLLPTRFHFPLVIDAGVFRLFLGHPWSRGDTGTSTPARLCPWRLCDPSRFPLAKACWRYFPPTRCAS